LSLGIAESWTDLGFTLREDILHSPKTNSAAVAMRHEKPAKKAVLGHRREPRRGLDELGMSMAGEVTALIKQRMTHQYMLCFASPGALDNRAEVSREYSVLRSRLCS
jgi:hypothetical protein